MKISGFGSKWFLVAVFVCGSFVPRIAVADDSISLSADRICTAGAVDKTKLLNVLLQLYKVDMPVRQAEDVLSDDKLLVRESKQYHGLLEVVFVVDNMLRGDMAPYKAVAGVSEEDYFNAASQVSIQCGGGAAPSIALTTPKKAGVPIRVRGVPSDLIYSQSAPQFQSASKASINFKDDGSSGSRTDLLQAAVGVEVRLADYDTLVAYVAANRSVKNSPGKPESTSQDTFDFGIAAVHEGNSFKLDLGQADPERGHFIYSATPDYLMNFHDGSRLFNFHLAASPYLPGIFNAWINAQSLFCGSHASCKIGDISWLSFQPLVSVISDIGSYTNKGTTPAQIFNQDYFRVGSAFGLGISATQWVDITIMHTYLHGFTGSRDSVNYFQASATVNLIPKLVGVTVGYQNGLLEQTATRDQSWTVGLTAKY